MQVLTLTWHRGLTTDTALGELSCCRGEADDTYTDERRCASKRAPSCEMLKQ